MEKKTKSDTSYYSLMRKDVQTSSLSAPFSSLIFLKLRTNKLLAVGVFYFFTDSQRLEVLALRASSPYIVHVKYSRH